MDNPYDLFLEIKTSDDVIASSDAAARVDEMISDRYLNRAIEACCTGEYGRLLLSKAVRDLIARFAPAGRPTMNAIPQKRRREFLNELASITGRALPANEPVRLEPVLAGQEPKLTVNDNQLVGVERALAAQRAKPIMNAHGSTRAEPTLGAEDARLISNGYEPIAVNGKVPVASGWNKRPSTIEAVTTERANHPTARSTGLRAGRLVGVDIDIVPPDHVEAIKRLATEVLGFTMLERVGAKGAMLCYRNETPIGKITVSGKHPNLPCKVEVLGAGQQFVAYGVHPDTGKPYAWTNSLGDGEPLRTSLDELPEVTPDKLRDFADRAAVLLTSLGYTDVKVSGANEAVANVRLDAPVNPEFDTPLNIERARILLRGLADRGDVAVEGQGGDSRTYQVACSLRDLG